MLRDGQFGMEAHGKRRAASVKGMSTGMIGAADGAFKPVWKLIGNRRIYNSNMFWLMEHGTLGISGVIGIN